MLFRVQRTLARSVKSSVPRDIFIANSRQHLSPCYILPAVHRQTQRAPFTTTRMAPFPTPSMDRPKHEMAFFPQMTTSLPSESAEFRRVLWTGLYSQLVLMTVPVGGDIGDEVRQSYLRISQLMAKCANLTFAADSHG